MRVRCISGLGMAGANRKRAPLELLGGQAGQVVGLKPRRTPLASPFDRAAARRYLLSAHQARHGHERIHLAITTDGQQAMGEVLLNLTTGGIGYIVGAFHRGQSLAARALRAMTEYAHHTAGLTRVILEIEPDNHPSIAVARSTGFRLTEVKPETVTDKERTYDLLTWEHPAPSSQG